MKENISFSKKEIVGKINEEERSKIWDKLMPERFKVISAIALITITNLMAGCGKSAEQIQAEKERAGGLEKIKTNVAKTIEKKLGDDKTVTLSFNHIVDYRKKENYDDYQIKSISFDKSEPIEQHENYQINRINDSVIGVVGTSEPVGYPSFMLRYVKSAFDVQYNKKTNQIIHYYCTADVTERTGEKASLKETCTSTYAIDKEGNPVSSDYKTGQAEDFLNHVGYIITNEGK